MKPPSMSFSDYLSGLLTSVLEKGRGESGCRERRNEITPASGGFPAACYLLFLLPNISYKHRDFRLQCIRSLLVRSIPCRSAYFFLPLIPVRFDPHICQFMLCIIRFSSQLHRYRLLSRIQSWKNGQPTRNDRHVICLTMTEAKLCSDQGRIGSLCSLHMVPRIMLDLIQSIGQVRPHLTRYNFTRQPIPPLQ